MNGHQHRVPSEDPHASGMTASDNQIRWVIWIHLVETCFAGRDTCRHIINSLLHVHPCIVDHHEYMAWSHVANLSKASSSLLVSMVEPPFSYGFPWLSCQFPTVSHAQIQERMLVGSSNGHLYVMDLATAKLLTSTVPCETAVTGVLLRLKLCLLSL